MWVCGSKSGRPVGNGPLDDRRAVTTTPYGSEEARKNEQGRSVMATRTGETTPTARVAPGPRGSPVLGSIGDIYRDRLRFVLDVASTYGDVAQYRVAHMRMYQVSARGRRAHPARQPPQ